MRNPFDELDGPSAEEAKGELVEGSFACQQFGCYEDVYEARWIEKGEILTWICPNQHISKIKGFKLYG